MKTKRHRLKYTPSKVYSKELFKRSPRASWSVCLYTPRAGLDEAYASHIRCSSEIDKYTREKWSWFIDDSHDGRPVVCYRCDVPVPEYIQAIVRLHEYNKET